MNVVLSLFEHVRAHEEDLAATLLEDGGTLRIHAADGTPPEAGGPVIELHEEEGAVLLDWTWRVPVRPGREEEVRAFLLAYAKEAIENHGWEVPIVLVGGPRGGTRLTKRREDLVGRLMFARPARGPGEVARADLYKWHLRRDAEGEYVCRYERSLEGEEVDAFLARGVESTGPFVLIADRS